MSKGRFRPWLWGILAGALAFNLAFLPQAHFPESLPRWSQAPQFLLRPLNFNGTLTGYRPDAPLPHFDGRSWLVNGAPVGRLGDYMLDTDLWDAPHTFGKIMLIDLPPSATNGDVRRSFEALSIKGICRVAVFDVSAPVEQQGLATAVQVLSFVDGNGESRRCYDIINGDTWTMSQAGPFFRYRQFLAAG